MVIPLLLVVPTVLGGLWFFSTGGFDDIGENISILIMGALVGIVLMKMLKL